MPQTTPRPAKKRTCNAVPYQLREWSRRAELVKKVLRMRRAGHSLNDAAKMIGEPIANLSRYVRAFRSLGVAGLMPEISTGRRTVSARLELTEADAREIAALSYRIVRREDIPAGCRAYAARPDCRPELRTALSGRIPGSVRAAIRTHLPASGK